MTTGLGILTGKFGRVALLDMDTGLTAHAHAHTHLIIKMSGPDQDFAVEGREVPLTEDRAVLVNSWQEHSYAPRQQNERTLFLAFYIEPGWLHACDPVFARCGEADYFKHPSAMITPDIRRRANVLTDMVGGQSAMADKVEDLVADIMARFASRHQQGKAGVSRAGDYRIRRAIRQMQEAHDCPFNFDDLARHAGLSRSRFNVLFRKTVGVSPAIYGNAIRLEASVNALKSQSSASEVSDLLGFSAPANFTRFFQQHTGVGPAAYRRAMVRLEAGS